MGDLQPKDSDVPTERERPDDLLAQSELPSGRTLPDGVTAFDIDRFLSASPEMQLAELAEFRDQSCGLEQRSYDLVSILQHYEALSAEACVYLESNANLRNLWQCLDLLPLNIFRQVYRSFPDSVKTFFFETIEQAVTKFGPSSAMLIILDEEFEKVSADLDMGLIDPLIDHAILTDGYLLDSDLNKRIVELLANREVDEQAKLIARKADTYCDWIEHYKNPFSALGEVSVAAVNHLRSKDLTSDVLVGLCFDSEAVTGGALHTAISEAVQRASPLTRERAISKLFETEQILPMRYLRDYLSRHSWAKVLARDDATDVLELMLTGHQGAIPEALCSALVDSNLPFEKFNYLAGRFPDAASHNQLAQMVQADRLGLRDDSASALNHYFSVLREISFETCERFMHQQDCSTPDQVVTDALTVGGGVFAAAELCSILELTLRANRGLGIDSGDLLRGFSDNVDLSRVKLDRKVATYFISCSLFTEVFGNLESFQLSYDLDSAKFLAQAGAREELIERHELFGLTPDEIRRL